MEKAQTVAKPKNDHIKCTEWPSVCAREELHGHSGRHINSIFR